MCPSEAGRSGQQKIKRWKYTRKWSEMEEQKLVYLKLIWSLFNKIWQSRDIINRGETLAYALVVQMSTFGNTS